jgi:hypothetical protein
MTSSSPDCTGFNEVHDKYAQNLGQTIVQKSVSIAFLEAMGRLSCDVCCYSSSIANKNSQQNPHEEPTSLSV